MVVKLAHFEWRRKAKRDWNPGLEQLGLGKAARRARGQGLGRKCWPEVRPARLALLGDYRWSSYRA